MKTKFAYVLAGLVVSTAACQQDNTNIERKLDQILQRLEKMPAGGGGGAGAGQAIGAGGDRGAAQGQRVRPPEPDRSKTYAVPVDNDPFTGPADAKVTLIKAYDYACPYCERVRPTMDQLQEKYGKDLRVVFKQLVVHPRNAKASALAFCAANKQGKAIEMDKLLWDKGFKQRQLDASDVQGGEAGATGQAQKCWDTAAGCPIVVGFATELGLNVEQFKGDMKGACQQLVETDARQLSSLGVSATPGFFINGRFLSGAMPIENFQALIDEELKKANDKIKSGVSPARYYQQEILDKGLKSLQPAEKG